MADNETNVPNTEQPAVTGQEAQVQDDPKWLPQRLAEARASAHRKLLAELGIADTATAKALLEDAARIKQAQMSEAEKTAAALAALQTELAREKQERAQLETEHKQERLRNAIRAAASSAHAIDPQDILDKIAAADFETLLTDTEPDKKQIDAKIAAIRKEKPYLFDSGVGSPSNRTGTVNTDTAVLTSEELASAKAFGVSPESFAKAKANNRIPLKS